MKNSEIGGFYELNPSQSPLRKGRSSGFPYKSFLLIRTHLEKPAHGVGTNRVQW
jgi:hypothetical protein